MRRVLLSLLLASLPTLALALSAEEKTSRACEKIYASLCKSVPKGDARLFYCGQKFPDLKIPEKCQGDYQQKFEGIVDAKTAQCVEAAQFPCQDIDSTIEGAAYLTACAKKHPKIFTKLPKICKALAG